MKVIAHSLVKNEERFIWYALNSVIDEVDQIIIFDTGSSDKTVEIIKSIKNPKIRFEEKGSQDAKGLSNLRNEMLKQSSCDWILILDGDEIWWQGGITKTVNFLNNHQKIDVVANPNYMLIGDIFHYQEELAGKYKILDKKGHYNIRLINRKIAGLQIEGSYPDEAFVDASGIKVQEFTKDKIYFLKEAYMHTSFLCRSSKRKQTKFEIGTPFPLDFYYPEVFFKKRPAIILSPWKNMNSKEKIVSLSVCLQKKNS